MSGKDSLLNRAIRPLAIVCVAVIIVIYVTFAIHIKSMCSGGLSSTGEYPIAVYYIESMYGGGHSSVGEYPIAVYISHQTLFNLAAILATITALALIAIIVLNISGTPMQNRFFESARIDLSNERGETVYLYFDGVNGEVHVLGEMGTGTYTPLGQPTRIEDSSSPIKK